MGRITHGGNRTIRIALVESSWILGGRDPAMRKKEQTIGYPRGAKGANIAGARTVAPQLEEF
jgi:hypothetical protein